ncbi:MAG: hypothetical protein ACFFAE_05110 [Candidatus Hodarchaeota archaeon]
MTTENLNKIEANEPVTCTWDADSGCEVCTIQGELDCKWERKHLTRFYLYGLPFFIPATIGMVLTIIWTRNWTGLIIYITFWLLFFGFFEIYVLCRHCPYYSEEGRILHCLANHGLLKIWRYNPGPMNQWEKAGLLIGFIIFLIIPIFTFVFGILTLYEADIGIYFVIILSGITFLTSGGALFFGKNLVTQICPHCVNFSCPLNRVPKKVRDAYLKKNPVMRQAWEKTGYRLG